LKERAKITDRLHISTIDESCQAAAREANAGIEIAKFCWAQYIDVDRESHICHAKELMQGFKSFWFHAPFAEIAPCAIDPKVLELTKLRYTQSVEIAFELGIRRLVIHGGYIPYVYYPQSYVERSVEFWKEFLLTAPQDITIALENVMEPAPDMLVEIAAGVDDKRLGLCLDVGHANCIISKTPPLDWIRPMSPYLKHVHIHNNLGDMDLHNALGEGSIPMEDVLDRVTELCPGATFTIENMNAMPSVKWLKDKGYID